MSMKTADQFHHDGVRKVMTEVPICCRAVALIQHHFYFFCLLKFLFNRAHTIYRIDHNLYCIITQHNSCAFPVIHRRT